MEYLPVRVRIKFFLKNILPTRLFEIIRSIWIYVAQCFDNQNNIVNKYQDLFISRYGRKVQGGPFKGMNYVDEAIGSTYFHKLVGHYEAVLHDFFEEIRTKEIKNIIDVGAAEGYYLIGLGLVFSEANLIGFEIDELGRRLTKELYEKNSLKNKISLFGKADAANVEKCITANTFLLCDCEGGELDILDPVCFPKFKDVDYALVELHDFLRPGIKEILCDRFKDTHNIEFIQFDLANPNKFPFLSVIGDKNDLYILRRERAWQEQQWMVLRKK